MNTPTPRTSKKWKELQRKIPSDLGWLAAHELHDFSDALENELTTALARVAELENERDAYKEGRDEAQRYFREVELFSRDRDEENKALYSEKESLTRQLSEAQAQLEKQRLILVANQKIMDGAGDTIAGLKAQLASAREDGARLDYLEKNRLWITLYYGQSPPMGSGLPFPFHGYTIGDIETPSPTLRSAIDAARGVSLPPPPTGKETQP